jgi:hypothetical protein
VTEFLIELYVPQTDRAAVAAAATRFRAAAAELAAEGRTVQLVRSIFVPADETCFLLVDGATADDVREAARRAAVPVDHVGETSPEHANGDT